MFTRLFVCLFVTTFAGFSCGILFPECTKNAGCASGVCQGTIDTGNHCVTGTFPGGACTSDATCAGGACDAGACACFRADTACSDNAQCCSGTCTGYSGIAMARCTCAADAGLCD